MATAPAELETSKHGAERSTAMQSTGLETEKPADKMSSSAPSRCTLLCGLLQKSELQCHASAYAAEAALRLCSGLLHTSSDADEAL